MGLVHYKIGEYLNALEYLKLALELAQQIGNESKTTTICNEKGEIYYLLKEYEPAFKCYSKALKIFIKLKGIVGIGKTINHISTMYNLTGLFNQSLQYSRKSLNIFQKLSQSKKNDKLTIKINESIALHNMGEAYFSLSRYLQAQGFLELALDIRKKLWEDSIEKLALRGNNFPKLEEHNYHHIYPQKMATYRQKEKDGLHRSIFAQYGNDLVKTLDLMEKVYQNLGKESEADHYHKQTVEISGKVNNDSWPVTISLN